MKKRIYLAALIVLSWGGQHAVANLLSGGGFEPIGGEIPFWTLIESVYDQTTMMDRDPGSVNSAERATNVPQEGTHDIQLNPWGGHFSVPAEERGPTNPNNMINAYLSQTVPATAGQEYNLSGWSRWEPNFSGGVNTLAGSSPLGAVPSPTTLDITLEFLNSSNAVIGSQSIDVKADRIAQIGFPDANDDFWYEHVVSAVAPVGTTQVRANANAKKMVFNTDPTQAAFWDNFTLHTTALPAEELLDNGSFNDAPLSGLDAWTITTNDPGNPANTEIIRLTGTAHTGTRGIWLSSFFGEPATPVDGKVSQAVPASVGDEFTFSGWARWETNYNAALTFMEMSFLDGSNMPIGSPITLNLATDGQTNNNLWMFHDMEGTAPAGTASVLVSAGFIGGVSTTGAQSAFFDDFELVLNSATLDGDFDGDGDVDGRDFLIWQRGGSPSGPLDAGDLADWQANYTVGTLAAGGTVPEPTTAIGLAVGMAIACMSRKRLAV